MAAANLLKSNNFTNVSSGYQLNNTTDSGSEFAANHISWHTALDKTSTSEWFAMRCAKAALPVSIASAPEHGKLWYHNDEPLVKETALLVVSLRWNTLSERKRT